MSGHRDCLNNDPYPLASRRVETPVRQDNSMANHNNKEPRYSIVMGICSLAEREDGNLGDDGARSCDGRYKASL
jgi:hypothetical protein